ncbi:unnamed protein product, partial [Lampetra fluviatilis]
WLEEPVGEVGMSGLQGDDATAAGSCAQEATERQPARAATILWDGQDAVPTKMDLPPKSRSEVPTLTKRFPFVREFADAVSDWAAFHRRFTATCDLAGWSDLEALRAPPTTLDDDALAAFYAIPPDDRRMLPQALAQMAMVFDPLSSMPYKFAARGRGQAETPLAFCHALMPLAQAAYPKMDQEGLESLVLECMFMLAQEHNVFLLATEDDDL